MRGTHPNHNHDHSGARTSDQEFLPEGLSGKMLYQPGDNKREQEWAALIDRVWKGKYK